jgi:DNA-binding GntR family transcriptional regulator
MKTYEKISKDIQEKIEKGIYLEGQQLPSLRELSKTYGSTTVTVKKSLGILEEKGYINTIDRRGSFVRTQENHLYTLIFHELKNIDQLSETKIIKMEEADSKTFRENFNIEGNETFKCIKIQRMLYQKKMPIGLDVKYLVWGSKISLPIRNSKHLGESLALVLSNYDIEKNLEITVLENNEVVRKSLFLDEEDPVFRFQQIYRTLNGQLVGAGETFVPCNEIRIKIQN